MEREYKVIIYPTAKRDLLSVIDYLNTLSLQDALKYHDLLTGEIASLATMPERCPRARDLALSAHGYRVLVAEKYLVFYKVVDDTVQIHRILFGKRNYKSLL